MYVIILYLLSQPYTNNNIFFINKYLNLNNIPKPTINNDPPSTHPHLP